MRVSRSTTCSGASARNSGMTSTVRSDTTMATTIARYTANRVRRCAAEKRCHTGSRSVSLIGDGQGTRRMNRCVRAEQTGEACALDEDCTDRGRQDFADHDQQDDGDEDGADIVVVESLEGCEQGAADP